MVRSSDNSNRAKIENTVYVTTRLLEGDVFRPVFIHEEYTRDFCSVRKKTETIFLDKMKVLSMVKYIERYVDDPENQPTNSNTNLPIFNLIAPLKRSTTTNLEIERYENASEENCLSFSITALRKAGVDLPEPK